MKNYFTLFFLLLTVFCFGQLKPISIFQEKESTDRPFLFYPISNELGNSIVAHRAGYLYLMLFDENFQLLKKEKIDIDFPSMSNQGCFYFQTKKQVFGVYSRKRGKAPIIVSVNKEDLIIRKEVAKISKSDKVFASFDENGFLYFVTSEKGTRDISIYKFSGFELVSKSTFKDSGKHQVSKWDKEYVSSLENEKVFYKDNSKKMFFQNEVLYFATSTYNKPLILTRIKGFDFKTEKTFHRDFKHEHRSNKNSKTKLSYEGAKRISIHILDNKLFQCARVRKDYYLSVFDLSNGELLVHNEIGEIIKGEKNNEIQISSGEPTFTGLFMNSKKSNLDWNSGGFSKSTTGIGIRKLNNDDLIVVFGKNKKLSSGGGYSPGIPGNSYGPSVPETFDGGGSANNRTHFGYLFMNKNGEILTKGSSYLSQFDLFKKHLESVRNENKWRAKYLEKKVFQGKNDFRMITYDPYESTFEIF